MDTVSKAGPLSFAHVCAWGINALAILLIIVAVLFGHNDTTESDPNGSLLVSQAIVEHGTIRLDSYQSDFAGYSYQIRPKNGHFYYYFPLGTSLVSVPLVALARMAGADMVRHEATMQLAIAAVVLCLSLIVMWRIAQLYLSSTFSAVIAAAFLFGSAFISTGATALWSHDFAALFALLAIYFLLADKVFRQTRCWPLFALCLFLAYLCRPTLLLLAPVAIGVQFVYVDKRAALKACLMLALLALGFMAWSWHEFHQLLPDYYLPQRLGSNTFWLALYGNLASPARGLFVYSPFLLLPVLCAIPLALKYPHYRAEIWLLLWPVLHLVVISKFPHWWAGYSYGPRLMYDVLPGLFVIVIVFLRFASAMPMAFMALAAVLAIAINLGQGIFNGYASHWNVQPSVDKFPSMLFDWRYPQFLHNEQRHYARIAEVGQQEMVAIRADDAALLAAYRQKISDLKKVPAWFADNLIHIGERYKFTSKALVFINWSVPEAEFRWSDGRYSGIGFVPDDTAASIVSIRIEFESIGDQTISVSVNDENPSKVEIPGGNVSLSIDVGGRLKAHEMNLLQFEMPQARLAARNDLRIVSIAVKSVAFLKAD